MTLHLTYLTLSFALATASVATAAPETSQSAVFPKLSAQAQLVVDHMRSQGRCEFFMLDKEKALLMIFNNCQESFAAPALYGEKDDTAIVAGSTPVGEFPLHVNASDYPGGKVITYLEPSDDVSLVIHATTGPDRARRYGNPALSAASLGCINIQLKNLVPFTSYVSLYAANHQTIPLLILPRKPDLNRTRIIFRLPTP